MKSIEIENIQAIARLSIPVPPEGGIVVCTGSQGAGKSTALECVSKGLGGTTTGLQPRDNHSRGEMWLGEVKMTVTRGQTRVAKDELEVASIEGRFDISRLVDPQVKKEEAADAARLKALILLTGATATPSDFYEAVGGQAVFEGLGVELTEDPVLLEARISRALHAEAKRHEDRVKELRAEAKSKSDEAAEVDTSAEHDAEKLSKQWAEALSTVQGLKDRQKAAREQTLDIANAAANIDKLGGITDLKTAASRVTEAQTAHNKVLSVVDDLEGQLRAQRQLLQQHATEIDAAEEAYNLEKKRAAERAALREVIDAQRLDPVSDDEVAQAEHIADAAHQATLEGQKIRDAMARKDEADALLESAKSTAKLAERYRDQAKRVQSVLAKLLPDCPITYHEGRLVAQTDRSAHELYSDLSDGERAALAIEVAASVLSTKDRQGLIVAPQWMYEGWTQSTRDSLSEKLKAHKLVLLTAEARDGELKAETYEVSDDLPG